MNRPNSSFILAQPGWSLAPAAQKREEQVADPDDPPTLAEVMAWLSGMPKGAEDAYDLKQQLMRENVHLPKREHTPLFMASQTEFTHIMQADFEANRRVTEDNNTALCSAAWHHQLMLLEYLDKRRMRQSFARNTAPRAAPANIFTAAPNGPQQVGAFCRLLARATLQAPVLRKA